MLGKEIPHCYQVGGGPCPERFGPTHVEQKSNGAQSSGIRQSLEKGLLNILRHIKIDHSKRNDTVSKFEIDRHESWEIETGASGE